MDTATNLCHSPIGIGPSVPKLPRLGHWSNGRTTRRQVSVERCDGGIVFGGFFTSLKACGTSSPIHEVPFEALIPFCPSRSTYEADKFISGSSVVRLVAGRSLGGTTIHVVSA